MFWSLKRSTTLPSSKLSGKPILTRLDGSVRTLGIMKRRVYSVQPPRAAAIVVQARANHELTKKNRKLRRSAVLPLAGGLGAGFGAAAGAVFVPVAAGGAEAVIPSGGLSAGGG